MIDLILAGIVVGVAFLVSNDGAWSAGVTFLCALLSGLLAMNFFEPLAELLSRTYPPWQEKWDMIALLGLFIAFIFVFRMGTERIAPTYIGVHAYVDQVGRWLFGALTGYVTMAFLLTALHTAPLPREFLGFRPERPNLLNAVAPDRQWLGFVQYVSEKALSRFDLGIQVGAPLTQPHAFDAKYELIGDPNSPYPNTIWSSFPMRYATRRSQLYGTAPMSAGPPVAAPAPGPVPMPMPTPGGNQSSGF